MSRENFICAIKAVAEKSDHKIPLLNNLISNYKSDIVYLSIAFQNGHNNSAGNKCNSMTCRLTEHPLYGIKLIDKQLTTPIVLTFARENDVISKRWHWKPYGTAPGWQSTQRSYRYVNAHTTTHRSKTNTTNGQGDCF